MMNTLRNPNVRRGASVLTLSVLLLGAAACSGEGTGNNGTKSTAPSAGRTSSTPSPTEGGNPQNGKPYCTTAKAAEDGRKVTFNTIALITRNGRTVPLGIFSEHIDYGDGSFDNTSHPEDVTHLYSNGGDYTVATTDVSIPGFTPIECTTINIRVTE